MPTSIRNLSAEQLAQTIRGALQSGDSDLAERAIKRLKQVSPRSAFPYWALAHLALLAGDAAARLSMLRKCVKMEPNQVEYRLTLSRALRREQLHDEALTNLNEVIRLKPDSLESLIEKADLLEHAGRSEEAEAVLDNLPAIASDDSRAVLVRANLALRKGDHEKVVDLTHPAADNSLIQPDIRSGLLFLCGQAYDKLREPGKAISVLKIAKQLSAAPFDRAMFENEIDRTLVFFTKDRLAQLSRAANDSSLPVFIATMPRSGSTLLDQIIDAHPSAAGVGELAYFYSIRMNLLQSAAGYPDGFASMRAAALDKIATDYLRRVGKGLKAQTKRLSDKSIENFREAGVIALAFPQARMIHLKRNAIDCCLSMFMHPFTGGLAGQTSTLRNIGFFYRQHERCMAHWKSTLDLPILELNYEDLVADPESEVRRMLEFCDLPWDERCLDFHKSKRTVRTLSYQQVSKPIYTSSVGRGEMYEPFIGELLEELSRYHNSPSGE